MASGKGKRNIWFLMGTSFLLFLVLFIIFWSMSEIETKKEKINGEETSLLKEEGETSLKEVLEERRSVREYKAEAISLREVSAVVWAAQGITEKERGFRVAPSAGATYPLEVYLVAGDVEDLDSGVYRFLPERETIKKVLEGEKRDELSQAALGQRSIKEAPASIVITAVYERTTTRYGERGVRYVHMEAGHVGQNIYLQCESLGLGTVAIGAFDDKDVQKVLHLPSEEVPLYIFPLGKKP